MKPWRPTRLALVGVFALALATRLTFLLWFDQPLLFSHQYTYFSNALRIAQHSDPWSYVLKSDEWRTWGTHWTIAPLYYVFAATVLRLFGEHLVALQAVQCVLDAWVAVLVAVLGRRVAGRFGTWAGVAYAVHWPAFEMPSWTMTENLHTPLLVAAIFVLAHQAPGPKRLAGGGFLLGLSALARSVSSGFLGLLVLDRLVREGFRRGATSAFWLALGGVIAVSPWLVRNPAIGEPPMIETAAYENLWFANHLGDRAHHERQKEILADQPTPAAKRAVALRFALNGVRKHPDLFWAKVRSNFWHFLRPDWLDSLLRVERPAAAWQHALGIVTEDLLLLGVLPLFLGFLAVGARSPTRNLIFLWTAYYLFMIVVVFHNELRYRSALSPLALAGAAAGWALLRDPVLRRRISTILVMAFGTLLSLVVLRPYLAPSFRALSAAIAWKPALRAVDRGDLVAAQREIGRSAAHDPASSRPWNVFGVELARSYRHTEAVTAFDRARQGPPGGRYISTVVLPVLLREAGQSARVSQAVKDADAFSWSVDPWWALEIAWNALPPPRTDHIFLGQGQADYGAVRGFFHPRGGDSELTRRYRAWNQYEDAATPPPPGPHRWSRHRAELRLFPPGSAPAYLVTLHMGSPFPSPLAAPEVAVTIGDAPPVRFTLDREIRPFTLRTVIPLGSPISVRLDAPTWNRPGEPAEQGVRVDRLTVVAVE